jgi:hypothetical protein
VPIDALSVIARELLLALLGRSDLVCSLSALEGSAENKRLYFPSLTVTGRFADP